VVSPGENKRGNCEFGWTKSYMTQVRGWVRLTRGLAEKRRSQVPSRWKIISPESKKGRTLGKPRKRILRRVAA